MKLYQILAQMINYSINIDSRDDIDHKEIYQYANDNEEYAQKLAKEHMPYGSGFDGIFEIRTDKCKIDMLVFAFEYHCMHDNGYYDGWINCELIVTPSLVYGYNITLNWKGYKGEYKELLNEYFYDTFSYCLDKEIPQKEIEAIKREIYNF